MAAANNKFKSTRQWLIVMINNAANFWWLSHSQKFVVLIWKPLALCKCARTEWAHQRMGISDHHSGFIRLDKIGCDEWIHNRRYVKKKNWMCRIGVGSSLVCFPMNTRNSSIIQTSTRHSALMSAICVSWMSARVTNININEKSLHIFMPYVCAHRMLRIDRFAVNEKTKTKNKHKNANLCGFVQPNKPIVCYSNPFWFHRVTANCVVIVATWRHSLILIKWQYIAT